MTAPYTPEQWQDILTNALAAKRSNPQDTEAIEAIASAVDALNAFEQPVIQAGEQVGESGFGKVGPALAGLGEAALDIPRGIVQTAMHPIETIKSLPKLPGALAAGLASGEPEQIARTVGNIGTLALPFARTSKAAAAPTVGGLAGEVAKRPFTSIGDVLRLPTEKMKLSEAKFRSLEQTMKQRSELQPLRMERAKLGIEQAKAGVERAPIQTERAQLGIKQAKAGLEQAPVKAEKAKLGVEQAKKQLTDQPLSREAKRLANELKRLQVEITAGKISKPKLRATIERLEKIERAVPAKAVKRGGAKITSTKVKLKQTSQKGFEVTGERATPEIATEGPTLFEMQQGITPTMIKRVAEIERKAATGETITAQDLIELNALRTRRGLPQLSMEDIMS